MTFPARLDEGYRAFLGDRFVRERARFERVAARQRPEVMVIGCCDSRVSPEVIFDAHPGEIFVARNVANLVPPYETAGLYHGASAAVEFAVRGLQVKHIVVLGHARCGGIQAFARGATPLASGDFIGNWLSLIAPAAERVAPGIEGRERLHRLELATVELSLSNLMTFPWVRALVEQGGLKLHGAHFGVGDGVLLVRDTASGEFRRLVG
ncbi:MAG: carbonic anhydrase [Alphaproteobacteria bacterium]|nr:carbonic anhydrase [Alphaproteobacteria bacterium]MBM4437936.1 carbonic anhydrase [Actinomycetota bacterium]